MNSNKLRIILPWLFFVPVLFTGTVFYEGRLDFINMGLSFNTILFGIALILMLNLELRTLYKVSLFVLIPLVPVIVWLESSYSPYDLNYEGIQKYLDFVLIGGLGAVILFSALKRKMFKLVVDILVIFFVVLLALTVLWKLKYGFWDRHAIYFLHGPIVFGRHMAMGVLLLIALYTKKDWFRLPLILLFSFGLIWSMSKGPILATIVVVLLTLMKDNLKLFFGALIVVIFLLFQIISNNIDLSYTPFSRLQTGLQSIYSQTDTGNRGSVGARNVMYSDTLELIYEYPLMGVGFGNWSKAFNTIYEYPHNLFLEIFSELGLFFGIILLLPSIVFLRQYTHFLYPVALFLLLAQQISGNVSDARWLLMFSLFMYLSKRGFKSKMRL